MLMDMIFMNKQLSFDDVTMFVECFLRKTFCDIEICIELKLGHIHYEKIYFTRRHKKTQCMIFIDIIPEDVESGLNVL